MARQAHFGLKYTIFSVRGVFFWCASRPILAYYTTVGVEGSLLGPAKICFGLNLLPGISSVRAVSQGVKAGLFQP